MPHSIDELVSQQVRRAELARRAQISNGKTGLCNVIAISRTMGSGARIVAQKVADDLGWALWGREILDGMAVNADVSREVIDALDEKSVSEIELLAREMLGDHANPTFYYQAHLAKAIRQVAKLGNAVILGRGASMLLPDALHIRIEASEAYRAHNMVAYENMTEQAALKKIRASDRERERFHIHTFGKAYVKSAHYDVTIFMDRLSTIGAADIVKSAVGARWMTQQKLSEACKP